MESPETPDDPEDADETEPKALGSCCPYRRKVLVGILKVLTEEECGIPDSELADLMRFDLNSPTGKPVLAFQFCPWCGRSRKGGGETRIVDVSPANDPDGGGSLET